MCAGIRKPRRDARRLLPSCPGPSRPAALEADLPTSDNQLIDALPGADRKRLLAKCEPAQLALAEVLGEPGQPLRHAYFPTRGFISLWAAMDDRHGLEVAMVGDEGMLGAHLALGVEESPLRALVQGAGGAWRIDTATLRAELARSAALQRVLSRYLYVQMVQLSSSAACMSFHMIGPRLARWLLMSHDRAHGDHFHVTQEFLASMLGVRRVGITVAAGVLHRRGLIAYHRGELTVLDRTGLEAASCSCYRADVKAYADLFRSSEGRFSSRRAAGDAYTVALKSEPTPAVAAIASAPQKVTRPAPASTPAPPTRAAMAPSRARKTSEVAGTQAMSVAGGASAVTPSGSAAPTVKLAAEASAACTGRALMVSEMPSSSRA